MKRAIFLALALASICSCNNLECERIESLEGTFLLILDETSGNCGAQDPVIVTYPSASDPACARLTNEYSDHDCRQVATVECVYSSGTVRTQSDWTQIDEDGSREGTWTTTITAPNGAVECASTYDVSLMRQ